MNYKFFTNSESAWQAMYEAIKEAKESVYLEMYIMEDGNLGEFNFLELLEKKARAGVRLHILLDSLGSFSFKSAEALRAAGAEIIFSGSFFHRLHRKILIVDEQIGFLGGVNLYKTSRRWQDLMVSFTGKRLVAGVVRSFAKAYAREGGRDPVLLLKSKRNILPRTRTWLVEHFPSTRMFGMKQVYKKYLRNAEKSITLVTPYFMPKRWFVSLLKNAAKRGVRIEVLVPKTTDHFWVDRVEYFFMNKLSRHGVHFYMQPEMNHAKVMLVDGATGILGSNNLDFLSFEFNSEVGIFFKDEDTVRKIARIIANWQENAQLFDSKKYEPSWFDHLLSPFIRIFFRII